MHHIYLINCLVNNKNYVGQTNYPERRWSQHKYKAIRKHDNQVITRAMIKYGIDNFTFNVVASCQTQKDVNALEEEIMQQYDTRNSLKGYNVDVGGGVLSRPKEINEKISKSLKAYYKANPDKNKGRKHSEEAKKKMSDSSMGKLGTNKGKEFDDEWKNNMSVALSGREDKKNRRFSEEEEKEICRMYVEFEMSTYAIEKLIGCYRTTINDILLRNQVKIRQSNYTGHNNNCNIFTEEQELVICEEWKSGSVTREYLSKKYNCGKTTIREILIRHKVDLGKKHIKNNINGQGN